MSAFVTGLGEPSQASQAQGMALYNLSLSQRKPLPRVGNPLLWIHSWPSYGGTMERYCTAMVARDGTSSSAVKQNTGRSFAFPLLSSFSS